jgi:hypothetical protein
MGALVGLGFAALVLALAGQPRGKRAAVAGDEIGAMDTKPDPETGRTTRCDTSIPWWGKVLHKMVQLGASVFTGPAGYKLTGAAMDKIQDETGKLDGRALKKWMNKASNAEVIVWGIAHAKGFVDQAWQKTDHRWPMRKAALESLDIRPTTFDGGRGAQMVAALKVVLLASFSGGIEWCYCRHVTEAILLQIYDTLGPLIPIIEKRGHDKKRRPAKETWSTTAGPYVLDTLALLEAAAHDAQLPPAAAPVHR